MRWRVLLSPPATGAENMALDEALLMRASTTGESVLRVYTWARPTLSFGRHQAARGHYDAERVRARGLDLVRRPTGGRAILHWREVTYAVTAPVTPGEALGESYGRINRLLVDGLRRLGVRAEIAQATGRPPRPDATPCFTAPTAGEVMADGRKLVGSAQCREAGALLQHGSILVEDDQTAIASLLREAAVPSPPPATLHDLMGRAPDLLEIGAALFAAVRSCEDERATHLTVDSDLSGHAAALRHRYEDDRWTWRR